MLVTSDSHPSLPPSPAHNSLSALPQGRWMVPLTLVLSTAAYEVAGNRVMVVMSDFYVSITGHDIDLYLRTLWLSMLIVVAVVLCKVRREGGRKGGREEGEL